MRKWLLTILLTPTICFAQTSVKVWDGTQTADVTAANALKTDSSAVTQPVSAASLPLPSGAATAANQSTIIGHVDGIEGVLGTIDADTGTIAGAVSGTEMQVDVLTMPTTTVQATDLDIRDLTSVSDSVAAWLSDGSGNAISSTGGSLDVNITGGASSGTEYTEDAAAAANPAGGALILVRDDALSGQTTTDGDNVAARGTDKGEIYVKHVDAIPVTDNGGALTVDGTVAVSNSFALDASVDGIEGLLTTIDADTSSLAAFDFATETTLATLALDASVDGVEGLLTTIDADTSTLAATDFMLGTDFSNVMGTASLVLGTQADDLANTSDGLQTSSLLYVYDGSTWDRLRGTSADGVLVNLGANNDVTVTGTVDVSDAFALESSVDGIEGLLTTIDADTGSILTAVQVIDDFISGSRGLVTEDNSAAILTALQTIDNMISGSEAQVDVVTLPALAAGTNTIGKVDHTTTGIGNGRKTVSSAGTAEAIASSTAAKWVCITAEVDNTNEIVVGGSGVIASLATRQGTPLDAGDDICLPVDNLADVFIDAETNGEGVTYLYGF